MSLQADRARTRGIVASALLASVAGAVTAYALKVIIDAASQGDERGALAGAGAVAAGAALAALANAATAQMALPLKEYTGLLVDRRILDLGVGEAGFDLRENARHLDRVRVLQSQAHHLASAALNIGRGLTAALDLVLIAALLVLVEPVLVLLPLFALPSIWASARAERLREAGLEGAQADLREDRHLFELATAQAPAKELRVYGLGAEILARYQEVRRQGDFIASRASSLGLVWRTWGRLFFVMGAGAAIAVVVKAAIEGTATVGDVVLTLALTASLREQATGAGVSFSALARTAAVGSLYLGLAGREHEPGWAPPTLQAPGRMTTGIELCRLTFRYPGSEEDVLTDVDLLLPAGATVALVGENGSGKSTIVKLVCGLYEPTSGSILVEGMDLRRIDAEAWRDRVRVDEPDPPAEPAGEPESGDGLAFLNEGWEETAELARLNEGPEVEPPQYPEGSVGLGSGEGYERTATPWLKRVPELVPLPRPPVVRVLDDPAAALDPEAEHAVFDRYLAAVKEAGHRNGAVTILVSQRFSAVEKADVIAVVQGGRVVETGSHDELLAAGGVYAELRQLQARSYR